MTDHIEDNYCRYDQKKYQAFPGIGEAVEKNIEGNHTGKKFSQAPCRSISIFVIPIPPLAQ